MNFFEDSPPLPECSSIFAQMPAEEWSEDLYIDYLSPKEDEQCDEEYAGKTIPLVEVLIASSSKRNAVNLAEKVDSSSAHTGKMVQQINKTPIAFSSSPQKMGIKDWEARQKDSRITLLEMAQAPQPSAGKSGKECRESCSASEWHPNSNRLEPVAKTKRIRKQKPIKKTYVRKGVVVIKQKNDEKKNVPNNCLQLIAKEFISPKYRESVENLCKNNGLESSEAACSYYKDQIGRNISLRYLCTLLDPTEPNITDELRRIKLTFHSFFAFYMRHRYIDHILTEKKITRKEEYLEATRYLMNLPNLKPLSQS